MATALLYPSRKVISGVNPDGRLIFFGDVGMKKADGTSPGWSVFKPVAAADGRFLLQGLGPDGVLYGYGTIDPRDGTWKGMTLRDVPWWPPPDPCVNYCGDTINVSLPDGTPLNNWSWICSDLTLVLRGLGGNPVLVPLMVLGNWYYEEWDNALQEFYQVPVRNAITWWTGAPISAALFGPMGGLSDASQRTASVYAALHWVYYQDNDGGGVNIDRDGNPAWDPFSEVPGVFYNGAGGPNNGTWVLQLWVRLFNDTWYSGCSYISDPYGHPWGDGGVGGTNTAINCVAWQPRDLDAGSWPWPFVYVNTGENDPDCESPMPEILAVGQTGILVTTSGCCGGMSGTRANITVTLDGNTFWTGETDGTGTAMIHVPASEFTGGADLNFIVTYAPPQDGEGNDLYELEPDTQSPVQVTVSPGETTEINFTVRPVIPHTTGVVTLTNFPGPPYCFPEDRNYTWVRDGTQYVPYAMWEGQYVITGDQCLFTCNADGDFTTYDASCNAIPQALPRRVHLYWGNREWTAAGGPNSGNLLDDGKCRWWLAFEGNDPGHTSVPGTDGVWLYGKGTQTPLEPLPPGGVFQAVLAAGSTYGTPPGGLPGILLEWSD